MDGIKSSRREELIGKAAILLETYFLPALLFYLIWQSVMILVHYRWPEVASSAYDVTNGRGGIDDFVVFIKFAKRIILILFNVTVFLALIVRKELLQGPQRLREILLPLVIIFFWSIFNLTGFLPGHFIHVIVPRKLMFTSLFLGLVLVITGWLICLVGVYNIRYSFGVFAQVRPLVVSGFYHFCRHPVYLGYIVTTVGLCFSWPTVFSIVSAVLYIWLTVLRSRIEEMRLLAYSSEYKNYMKTTPMFFPFFNANTGGKP